MTTNDAHGAELGAEHPLATMTAFDVMTSDLATVTSATTVREAMTLMRTMGVRHLPVLGDGRFAGLVDDRLVAFTLLSASGSDDVLDQPVSTAMTTHVPQVGPGESVQRVAHLLRTSRCDAVVVIDAQEHLLGLITMVDVVATVALGGGAALLPDNASAPAATPVASLGPVSVTGARS